MFKFNAHILVDTQTIVSLANESYLFIKKIFLAALGLPCCMWGFCLDEWGYSVVAMLEHFNAVASLVAVAWALGLQ